MPGKTTSSGSKSSTCSCKTVYVESEIISFCKKELFKQYVREAINNEMFWRDIFDNFRIETRVDNHLNGKVPKMVKDNVEYLLPGLVAKQLSEQLPTFLRQNAEMQRILGEHSKHLNQELEATARQHLKRIVEEEHYHEVNKAFFDAVRARADAGLEEVRKDGKNAIAQMRADCDGQLSHFTDTVGRLDGYEQRTLELEASMSRMMWGWGITTTLLGGTICYLLARRH